MLFQFAKRCILKGSPLASLTRRNSWMFASKVVNLPNIADSITQGTIQSFLKRDYVEQDQTVALLQTEKVTVEIKSPNAGLINKLFGKPGDTAKVGSPFFQLDTDAQKPAGSAQKKVEVKTESPKSSDAPKKQEKKASPEKSHTQQTPAPPKSSSQSPIFTQSVKRQQKRQPLSRLRIKVAQRLKDAQNTYALLTTFQEVDMSAVMQLRKQQGEDFLKKHNVKLGFMSFFIKAVCQGIKDNPIINSVIDGNQVIHRNYVDCSVAVATPTGLLVPVIRNCQSLSYADIQKQLANLAKKGRDGKISLQEMAGGTFTISNGGVFGSLMGTPIINPPQSAILGLHAIINRPVVRGDQIVARPMMYIALTYDHRLLDGKDSATFLKKIQSSIQSPERMLLDL